MFHPKGPTFWELARQALSATTEGYDLLAEKFEYTPFRTPDVLLEPLAEAVGRRPVARALDCCCGNGAIARALRGVVTDEIVGIDLSAGMLDVARRLTAAQPAPPDDVREIRFEQMDAFAMNFERPFNVIATAGAFGHILEHQQDHFLEQVRANLTDDGRFLFITAPMPSRRSVNYWIARGFNGAMHVRNALVEPPFVMFYLTFTLERAMDRLLDHGFRVEVEAPYAHTPYRALRLVTATPKPA